MRAMILIPMATILLSLCASGDEKTAQQKVRLDFDIGRYQELINRDIGIPKPGCTLAQMGIPARSVEGRVIGHDGKPIIGAAVALVEPVGYSSHCYYDNFATTDDEGRFRVAGSVRKSRIVIRRTDEWVLVAPLQPDQKTVVIDWPEPATVSLTFPQDLAPPGAAITIRTRRYHAGMSAWYRNTTVAEEGATIFRALVPGDYVVTTSEAISFGDSKIARNVEIGSFSVRAGEAINVDCRSDVVAAVTGQTENASENTWVLIEREKLLYEDTVLVVQILKPANDGFFLSRRIPAGTYVAKVMTHNPQPAAAIRVPFARNARPLMATWRFTVTPDAQTIRLNELPQPESPMKEIIAVLQGAYRNVGRFRPTPNANRLKTLDDRPAAEQELLRMLADPTCPYNWRRMIPEILAELTDSPAVVDGLIKAAKNPVAARERGQILRAFSKVRGDTDRVTAALAGYVDDPDNITRGAAVRVLGELAVANPDDAERIVPLLERGLEDADETTRSQAADFLGRIALRSSLTAVLRHSDDVHGPTAVMSGFAAWKISGDPEHAFEAMNGVMNRSGLEGKWQAAWLLKTVAEKHKLPRDSIDLLSHLAKSVGKPPFRSTYEYEISRAGKLAQQTLDSL